MGLSNVDSTAKLEVVDSAAVSSPLELEGKEVEDKGTEPDPERELDPGGISDMVAAYNAEEEMDPDGDTEDAAPVEGPPLPSGWEELIDEGSGMPYYFNWSTNKTTWDRLVVASSPPDKR